jgi:Tol biopolymer transport system component
MVAKLTARFDGCYPPTEMPDGIARAPAGIRAMARHGRSSMHRAAVVTTRPAARRWAGWIGGGLVAAAALGVAAHAVAGPVALLSRTRAPADAAGGEESSMSADGRFIVFQSPASNVIPGQLNTAGADAIYLHDRVTGATRLVSHRASSPLAAGNGDSRGARISADGRIVAFESEATDLVAGQVDIPGTRDVFVHDRVTGITSLVSRTASSPVTAGNGESERPVISGNGRLVAFESEATDLVANLVDGNDFRSDVYLHDRLTGTTTLVSRAASSATTTGNSGSEAPVISSDGAVVAFLSRATDLLAGLLDGNGGGTDIFLFETATGVPGLVSRTTASETTTGNGLSAAPAISADGRFVAFESRATDLVAGLTDGNGASGSDVFRHDRQTGTTTLVSRSTVSATATANSSSRSPVISDDGGVVAFHSAATDLVAGQAGPVELNVFVRDLGAGTTSLVSGAAGSATTTGNGPSSDPVISATGGAVAFVSQATDLVPGQNDANLGIEVFRHDRVAGTTTLVTRAAGSVATAGDGPSSSPALSSDGSVVTFTSQAANLVDGVRDVNGMPDLFVFEAPAAEVALVSRRDPSRPSVTAGRSFARRRSASADGRYVVFTSLATGLVEGQVDVNHGDDVFLHDRVAGTTTLVSRAEASATTAGNGRSIREVISADGRFVAFQSQATDLVAGQVDANDDDDVFVYDRVTGVTVLVSHVPGSLATTGNRVSEEPVISADGGLVAFASEATDLVSGQIDTNGASDVFLGDRETGDIVLVSHLPESEVTTANDGSQEPVISADGRSVVYVSQATNLLGGQVDDNNDLDVFLYDQVSRTTILISRTPLSAVTTGNNQSEDAAISADGLFVAFESRATDLVADQADTNEGPDVFLYDRAAQVVTLISRVPGPGAVTGNGTSFVPVMNADGRFVVFGSGATDLVAGLQDDNGVGDVFLFDREGPTLVLVSRSAASPLVTGSGDSGGASLSATGAWVAFGSRATNLVVGQEDGNGERDAFLFDRAAGATSLISRAAPRGAARTAGLAVTGNAPAEPTEMSADGSVVVLQGSASNLTADEDRNGLDDVFIWVRPCSSDGPPRPCAGTAARGVR